MTMPAWPANINAVPYRSGRSTQPFEPPIATEMEDASNRRERARPGDDVKTIRQVVPVLESDWPTLEALLLENRGKRIVMPVWLDGVGMRDCVVMVSEPRSEGSEGTDLRIAMTLRVYREVPPP